MINNEQNDILEKLTKNHVLCVGDIILDRYIYGNANRLSPEAPIPVLEHKHNIYSLGGAGNVASNIATIGAKCTLISICGKDNAADIMKHHLEQLNTIVLNGDMPKMAIHSILITDDTRNTSVKNRYIVDQQQLLRVDNETTTAITPDIEQEIITQVNLVLPNCTAVILSDYGKGLLTPTLCQYIITQANKLNIPIIIDPKGSNYQKYSNASLITPNRKELFEATNMAVNNDANIISASQHLMRSFNIKGILTTRSEQGMTAVWENNVWHRPTKAIEVYDVTGAGDTVVAFIALALGSKMNIPDSMDISNTSAGIVVQKRGTATVTPFEFIQNYHSHSQELKHNVNFYKKIIERKYLKNLIQHWREQNLSIGFTNGCFDLLHMGHIELLSFTKSRCDRMIVGLNSDASVKRLKGTKRPINNQESRQIMLATLEMVDAVVIFDEDTPFEIICEITPDLLVKGGDYTIATTVGAKETLESGGKVEIFPIVDGFSSTNIIKCIEEGKDNVHGSD